MYDSAMKKKVIVIIHVATPATFRLTLPHYVLPLPFHIMHAAFAHTHTQTALLECCHFHDTYGPLSCVKIMVGHPFTACIISVDHCSINCRGSKTWISCISGGSLCAWISCISAVQEAVSVSLQSHTASLFPWWSVPLPLCVLLQFTLQLCYPYLQLWSFV